MSDSSPGVNRSLSVVRRKLAVKGTLPGSCKQYAIGRSGIESIKLLEITAQDLVLRTGFYSQIEPDDVGTSCTIMCSQFRTRWGLPSCIAEEFMHNSILEKLRQLFPVTGS